MKAYTTENFSVWVCGAKAHSQVITLSLWVQRRFLRFGRNDDTGLFWCVFCTVGYLSTVARSSRRVALQDDDMGGGGLFGVSWWCGGLFEYCCEILTLLRSG